MTSVRRQSRQRLSNRQARQFPAGILTDFKPNQRSPGGKGCPETAFCHFSSRAQILPPDLLCKFRRRRCAQQRVHGCLSRLNAGSEDKHPPAVKANLYTALPAASILTAAAQSRRNSMAAVSITLGSRWRRLKDMTCSLNKNFLAGRHSAMFQRTLNYFFPGRVNFMWQQRSSKSLSVAAGTRSLAPQSRQIISTAERRTSML